MLKRLNSINLFSRFKRVDTLITSGLKKPTKEEIDIATLSKFMNMIKLINNNNIIGNHNNTTKSHLLHSIAIDARKCLYGIDSNSNSISSSNSNSSSNGHDNIMKGLNNVDNYLSTQFNLFKHAFQPNSIKINTATIIDNSFANNNNNDNNTIRTNSSNNISNNRCNINESIVNCEVEAIIHILFTINYIKYFKKSIKNNIITLNNNNNSNTSCSINIAHISKLIEICLRGNKQEIIIEHMLLYSYYNQLKINEERLQECLYSLYEPELLTYTDLFLLNHNASSTVTNNTSTDTTQQQSQLSSQQHQQQRQLHQQQLTDQQQLLDHHQQQPESYILYKYHNKLLPSYMKTYLLDKFDLNMKIRCIIAWSANSNYKGFHSLSNDLYISIDDIIQSQQLYYPNHKNISVDFFNDYITNRNEHYHEKKDNNDMLKKGVAFVIVTCLLDWFICSL